MFIFLIINLIFIILTFQYNLMIYIYNNFIKSLLTRLLIFLWNSRDIRILVILLQIMLNFELHHPLGRISFCTWFSIPLFLLLFLSIVISHLIWILFCECYFSQVSHSVPKEFLYLYEKYHTLISKIIPIRIKNMPFCKVLGYDPFLMDR